jgi:hypothetical protein
VCVAIVPFEFAYFFVSEFRVEVQSGGVVFPYFQAAFADALLLKHVFDLGEKGLSDAFVAVSRYHVHREYVPEPSVPPDFDACYGETDDFVVCACRQPDGVVVTYQVGYLLFCEGVLFEALFLYRVEPDQEPEGYIFGRYFHGVSAGKKKWKGRF